MDKKEKEVIAKIINEKAADVVYGNNAAVQFTEIPEETKEEAKQITEKLQFELDKRALVNKTKEQLIEDLGDLYDLFEIKSNEAEVTKKKLQDVEGDVIILQESAKEKNYVISGLQIEIDGLKKELAFQNRMQNKLEEIIDKMIKG